jgi:ketosteroid isomerase-like protein
MKRLLALLLALLPCLALASTTDEVTAVLKTQAAAWNRGDIDAFMEYYWKDDALRFASGGTVSRGWLMTLDRYHESYPDREAMGTLTFTDLEITELAPDAAIAFGRWTLLREHDSPHGLFTLTFRRIDGKWVIVQDHTSSGS